ncbi:MAG TPA: hypothetical protein VKV24_00115 [Casimicrobiaceae bacterium]|nr:hypothetical protein [Casimicrobiaceae bacterium]
MSDGPYRSLPMSRCWKRLAEFSENENFGNADICAAAVEALKRTCRSALPAELTEGLRSAFVEQQARLFSDQRVESVDALRPLAAGRGIGKLLLDHATCVLNEGGEGESGLTKAAERMLTAVGASHTRQIEEHYVRQGASPLTQRVVSRVEQALDSADKRTLARQLCGLEPGVARHSPLKRKDIDDGVPL